MGSPGRANSEVDVELGVGRIERAQRLLFLRPVEALFFLSASIFCHPFQMTLMRVDIAYYLPERFGHRRLPLS
jgi:hypothetical protein